MIVRPRPGILSLFFVMRGSIVPRIAPQILGFCAYAALVVWVVRRSGLAIGGASALAPFTLLGVTLSIYLGFRNNAAYDRWWEARRLWGTLVVEIRNLARQSGGLLDGRGMDRRELLTLALAFVHCLRGELRGCDVEAEIAKWRPREAGQICAARNRPDAAMRLMGAALGALRASGDLQALGYRMLEERLSALAAVQAGCERIAATPLPFAYTLLLHRSAYIFCVLLPWGMAGLAGWSTPLFTALVAYSYFGLDALSEELEEPFGLQPNDLALDALCRSCEISVCEALGEPAPSPLVPSGFTLS